MENLGRIQPDSGNSGQSELLQRDAQTSSPVVGSGADYMTAGKAFGLGLEKLMDAGMV